MRRQPCLQSNPRQRERKSQANIVTPFVIITVYYPQITTTEIYTATSRSVASSGGLTTEHMAHLRRAPKVWDP